MFRRIHWKLLATYLIVVCSAVIFLGVHLVTQFEAAYTAPGKTDLTAQVRHFRAVVAWAAVIALLIAGALGLVLARGIAAPVQEMQRAASSLAAGRLSERVPVRTQDELGDLARTFNYMASELERIDSLRRAFVADASHELRTPVANLAVAVEELQAAIGMGDFTQARGFVADVEREVQRLRRLVDGLLDLSMVESGKVRLNLAPVVPADVITRATDPFRSRAEQAGVALRTEVPPRLPRVRADADRIIPLEPAGQRPQVHSCGRHGHRECDRATWSRAGGCGRYRPRDSGE